MTKSSGKFVVRVPSPLHRALVRQAHADGCSLNQLCWHFLERGLKGDARVPTWRPPAEAAARWFQTRFGAALQAVLAFGSQVSQTAHRQSDLDLLVVLKHAVPITRQLYRQWDTEGPRTASIPVNPHFVHLPRAVEDASGLWYEVALAHTPILARDPHVTQWLSDLLSAIRAGRLERQWSNGHPYWIRRPYAESHAR